METEQEVESRVQKATEFYVSLKHNEIKKIGEYLESKGVDTVFNKPKYDNDFDVLRALYQIISYHNTTMRLAHGFLIRHNVAFEYVVQEFTEIGNNMMNLAENLSKLENSQDKKEIDQIQTKLAQLLSKINQIEELGKNYEKTAQFTEWLSKRLDDESKLADTNE